MISSIAVARQRCFIMAYDVWGSRDVPVKQPLQRWLVPGPRRSLVPFLEQQHKTLRILVSLSILPLLGNRDALHQHATVPWVWQSPLQCSLAAGDC